MAPDSAAAAAAVKLPGANQYSLRLSSMRLLVVAVVAVVIVVVLVIANHSVVVVMVVALAGIVVIGTVIVIVVEQAGPGCNTPIVGYVASLAAQEKVRNHYM